MIITVSASLARHDWTESRIPTTGVLWGPSCKPRLSEGWEPRCDSTLTSLQQNFKKLVSRYGNMQRRLACAEIKSFA